MVWISYVEDILATRIEIKTDVHLKITFSYYVYFAVRLQICIRHNEM